VNDEETPKIPMNLMRLWDETVSRLGANARLERLMDVMDQLTEQARAVKYLKAEFDKKMVEWINANGDITLGDIRYYVGTTKKIKPKVDASTIIMDLIETHKGDIAAAIDATVASGWCRYGEVRKVRPEKFDEWFETEVVMDVKTGKPKKSVQRADAKYAKAVK